MAATRFKTAALATLGIIFVSPAIPVLAQCEVATLDEPIIFGNAVDIYGDYGLVGSAFDNFAYFYRLDGMDWLLEATFTSGTTFGLAVALGNDYAVVGERWYSGSGGNKQGAVHVFKREGTEWVEDAFLTASDADWDQQFGWSVAIDGDRIVVGAIHDGENGENAGAAYVFTRQGTDWIEEAKLLPGGATAMSGHSVGISGDSIIVGALGTAYIFREVEGNWIEETSFGGGSGFGEAADIDGSFAVVGAKGVRQARVLQLEDGAWTQGPMLTASDDNGFSGFGRSVVIHGDYILVGAPEQGDDDDGAAHLFHRDGADWVEDYKFTPSQTSHDFGLAVSLNDVLVVVGTSHSDAPVYVYTHVLGDDCNANGVSDLCDIIEGTSTDEDGSTVPDECEVCPGDANEDGTVDPLDSGFVLSQFGCTPGNELCDLADVNGDGSVDPLDAGFVLARFGDCP